MDVEAKLDRIRQRRVRWARSLARRRDARVEKTLRTRYAPAPFMLSYLALLLVGLGLGGAVFLMILQLQSIPVSSVQFDDKQAAARSDALKIALTAAGGFAVIAGLYVNYRKQRNEEAGGIREQDRIFTERFNAAVGLLSSQAAAVRLGGINSLVRLADDSRRDRDTCLSTVCAYLRLPVPLIEKADEDERSMPERTADRSQWTDPAEWEVRRTALIEVLARLDRSADARFWEATEVDLDGAVLIDLSVRNAVINAELRWERSVVAGEPAIVDESEFYSTVTFSSAYCASAFSIMKSQFKGRAYFFMTTFADKFLVSECAFEHLSFAMVTANDRLAIRDSSFSGWVSFSGSVFADLALFADLDLAGLDRTVPERNDHVHTKDALDFRRAQFRSGFVLRVTAGDPYLTLKEATVAGDVEVSVRRLDIRSADLSRARSKNGKFVLSEICTNKETTLPADLDISAAKKIRAPSLGRPSQDFWAA